MENFDYAHRNTGRTSLPGATFSASLVRGAWSKELDEARKDAMRREIPVADDESLQYLLCTAVASGAKRILEIGTAVGLSATALLQALPAARITTIESDENFYTEAKRNFVKFGVSERVQAYLGDAGEILAMMDGKFDFVFLDGPKAQYIAYLPEIKRMLVSGGVLFADDVLLYGWVSGEVPCPAKRQSIVRKIREYLLAVTDDAAWITSVVNIGDGVALSVKR